MTQTGIATRTNLLKKLPKRNVKGESRNSVVEYFLGILKVLGLVYGISSSKDQERDDVKDLPLRFGVASGNRQY